MHWIPVRYLASLGKVAIYTWEKQWRPHVPYVLVRRPFQGDCPSTQHILDGSSNHSSDGPLPAKYAWLACKPIYPIAPPLNACNPYRSRKRIYAIYMHNPFAKCSQPAVDSLICAAILLGIGTNTGPIQVRWAESRHLAPDSGLHDERPPPFRTARDNRRCGQLIAAIKPITGVVLFIVFFHLSRGAKVSSHPLRMSEPDKHEGNSLLSSLTRVANIVPSTWSL